MEAIETIERAGFAATVHYDMDATSPEDWSTVGTLAYRHREASVGDLPHADYRLDECLPDGARLVLPVRSWDDRMGTELRVADSWDEATGWIFATAESVTECIGADATDEQVRDAMGAELVAWQQWAQGDVYGVVVTGPDGAEVDACWGFYGMDAALSEAERMLTDAVEAGRFTCPRCSWTLDAESRGNVDPTLCGACEDPANRRDDEHEPERRREADRALGAAVRALYVRWAQDDDEPGELANAGSAADQCAELYEVLDAHGLVVR